MNSWQEKKLGDTAEILSSKRVFARDYTLVGVPFWRGKEVVELSSGRAISTDLFISEETYQYLGRSIGWPSEGEILLTSVGTLGRAYRLSSSDRIYFKDGNLTWFRHFSKEIEALWLLYWLRSPLGQQSLDSSKIGSTQQALTIANLKNIPILCPPLSEQKNIAEILASLDDKIELNRRMNEVLEGMARAVFADWFVDFGPTRRKMAGEVDPVKILGGAIRPPAQAQKTAALFPDHLGKNGLPEGWEETTVKQMALRIQNGGTPSRKRPDYWDMGNVPWLTSGEVRQSFVTKTKAFITPEGLANSSAKLIPAGSVLIALYGATAGQVSFATVSTSTNQAVCAVIPCDDNRYYLLLAMRDKVCELERSAIGSAQQNISKKIVEDVDILRAPTTIHSEFEKVVGPLFSKVISSKQENQTLAEMRDLLLPKLMSGEIRLREGG